MACPNFTPADFAKWNTTASCFRIPRKLIGQVPIKEVGVLLVKAIGEERVCAVQALLDSKYRIEFASPSIKSYYDINGLDFRGINIVPTPAYEQLVQIFIDRAPLPMLAKYFISSLTPYGHVVSVQYPGATTSADYHSPSDTPRSNVPPVIMDVDTGSVVALAAPPAALQVDAPVSEVSAGVEDMMDASIVPPSTTGHLDSTVDASVLAASAVDNDVMDASVASSVKSRTTSTEGLLVEISEFKELLSFGEDFACHSRICIVQRWSTTRDKTKRLQKAT